MRILQRVSIFRHRFNVDIYYRANAGQDFWKASRIDGAEIGNANNWISIGTMRRGVLIDVYQ